MRLTIELEPDLHRKIKALAAFHGMSIKAFILSKIGVGNSELDPRHKTPLKHSSDKDSEYEWDAEIQRRVSDVETGVVLPMTVAEFEQEYSDLIAELGISKNGSSR